MPDPYIRSWLDLRAVENIKKSRRRQEILNSLREKEIPFEETTGNFVKIISPRGEKISLCVTTGNWKIQRNEPSRGKFPELLDYLNQPSEVQNG